MSKIPRGICQCGCGNKTGLATRDRQYPKSGYKKGEPLLFLRGHIGKLNAVNIYKSKLSKDEKGRTLKLCTACDTPKLLKFFNKSLSRLERRRSHCKSCERQQATAYYRLNPRLYSDRARAFNKKKYQQRKAEMNAIRQRDGCLFCGEKTLCVLDFHHIKGRSKHGGKVMARAANCSDKQFKKELKRCVVVCANCHRKVHAGLLSVEDRLL